jgi:hypothetical protein
MSELMTSIATVQATYRGMKKIADAARGGNDDRLVQIVSAIYHEHSSDASALLMKTEELKESIGGMLQFLGEERTADEGPVLRALLTFCRDFAKAKEAWQKKEARRVAEEKKANAAAAAAAGISVEDFEAKKQAEEEKAALEREQAEAEAEAKAQAVALQRQSTMVPPPHAGRMPPPPGGLPPPPPGGLPPPPPGGLPPPPMGGLPPPPMGGLLSPPMGGLPPPPPGGLPPPP